MKQSRFKPWILHINTNSEATKFAWLAIAAPHLAAVTTVKLALLLAPIQAIAPAHPDLLAVLIVAALQIGYATKSLNPIHQYQHGFTLFRGPLARSGFELSIYIGSVFMLLSLVAPVVNVSPVATVQLVVVLGVAGWLFNQVRNDVVIPLRHGS